VGTSTHGDAPFRASTLLLSPVRRGAPSTSSVSLAEAPDRDAALVRLCQRDPGRAALARRTLHERHAERVVRLCQRVTGNLEDAHDASQEAFVRAFAAIGDFDFRARFATWLYRIAANAAVDLRRRSQRGRTLSFAPGRWNDERMDGVPEPESREEPAWLVASRHEQSELLVAALERLSPPLRAVARLRFGESLSYEEVGAFLGISIGTVKSRLWRARLALERALEPARARGALD
jgi:RNA polymerase sigma-70 factor (ECF subfamily)